MTRYFAVLAWACSFAAAAAKGPRLNQIQLIGTHNSYHVAPTPAALEFLGSIDRRMPEAWDYTHPPLAEQFGRLGVRQIELDVLADPEGGLFADPALPRMLREAGKDPGPDPDPDGLLARPGFKVLHVPDVDYRTTAPTLDSALRQVRDWSRANPRHVPIMVLVELKQQKIPALPTKPVEFDAALLDALDAAILGVFPREGVFTPDDLRGDAGTLPEAVAGRGWPELDAVRGKVLFALDNEGSVSDLYRDGHPALSGRVLFAPSPEGSDAAAFFKLNDPVGDYDRIRRLVAAGYLVRTRADADTRQARQNDPSQRDKALSSGAHFVSTDYPRPREEWSPYRVELPGGGPARANPVSGAGLTVVE